MPGTAQRLKLRLFLEGVEIPIISARIACGPNAPVMASIQIPSATSGIYLKPRTLVHIFFLDFYEVDSPLLRDTYKAVISVRNKEVTPTSFERSALRATDEEGNIDRTSQEFQTAVSDLQNERWKLLFVGETMGFQWMKTSTARALVLQCADPSSYWEQAKQASNTGLFGPGYKAVFAGASTNLLTDFLSSPGEQMTQILASGSRQYPNLKGLLGGVVNLLERVGGSYHYGRNIAGQNIFYSLAELRLHMSHMITALENDPTTSRLLTSQGYSGLFNRLIGSQGGLVSIRSVINALTKVIYHECFGQPCPYYSPGTGGAIKGIEQVKLKDYPRTVFVVVEAQALLDSLDRIQEDANGNFSLDEPNYPSQQDLSSEDREKRKEAQRDFRKFRNQVYIRLIDARKNCARLTNRARAVGATAAASKLSSATHYIARATVKSNSIQWGSPKASTKLAELNKELTSAKDKVREVLDMSTSVTAKKDARPARLNQQILRPDIWFCSPIRCNVIFPEQYMQASYQRRYMEEPTRLLLKVHDALFGDEPMFDKLYFAPKAYGLRGRQLDFKAVLERDILTHELYTGILPKFEKMGETNLFVARTVVQPGLGKIGLAQRSTNFLYFKYRFAARQMQIQCRFNPYIAVGFPGVVLEKYTDILTLQRHNQLLKQFGKPTRDINKILGAAFLGEYTQVTHNCVASGVGHTDINCAYPREVYEGVELLGAIDREDMHIRKRLETSAIRQTDVAGVTPPRLHSLGPLNGEIVGVTDVTADYKTKGGGIELPLYRGPRHPLTGDPGSILTVPVAEPFVPASRNSPELNDALGNPYIPVTLKAYRIIEEHPRYRKEVVELPPEEYIRPAWYGDIWHPNRVHDAYNHFFKTGSITEKTFALDTDASTISIQDAKEQIDGANQEQSCGKESPENERVVGAILSEDQTIEQGVAFLQITYSYMKQNGIDVEEYLRAFTWRPIASMVDIFGTSDLRLSSDGTKVIQGMEGFHSRAFGDFSDLFGLVTPEIDKILGIKNDKTRLASKMGDTRGIKREAVLELRNELEFTRAVLG